MYIDTHSENSMNASICQLLHISKYELADIFREIYRTSDSDYDGYIGKLDLLISEHIGKELPDEILFFHFARRLNGTENDVLGRNLADLLTTQNAFSNFLKEHKLEFYMGDQHIETTYKGVVVDWDKCWNGNSSYMKVRLGYFKGREDYCFNGFAFKDRIYKNNYARSLYGVPEFIGQLVECLGCRKVKQDFMENSTYYCYEYKIPIDRVMFDDHDNYSLNQKQMYLIRCVLDRLVDYQTSDPRYRFDHDNPILRVGDNDTLPADLFIKKEVVTLDML